MGLGGLERLGTREEEEARAMMRNETRFALAVFVGMKAAEASDVR